MAGRGKDGLSRRDFIRVAAGAALGTALGGRAARTADRAGPNIVYYFPDQMRRQAMGFMRADPVVTPRLDAFAKESVVFTNAVSNCAVCSPYRAMLLSGRYPPSNGVTGNCNSVWPDNYLREGERCISDVLAGAGYECGFIGKWHLDAPDGPRGVDWSKGKWDAYTPPGPRRHGFGFWYSYGCMFDYMKPHFWTGNDPEDKPTVVEQWEPEHESDVAIEYIANRDGRKRNPAKPFFLMVAPHPPHPPLDSVPDKYTAPYRDGDAARLLNRKNLGIPDGKAPKDRAKKAIERAKRMAPGYFGGVTGVDDQFGRILDCLAREGLDRDTIVVFSSDHGEMLGSHCRFDKSVFYEESIGIPLIVRWPGRITPGNEEMPVGVPDMFPTLLGLAGLAGAVPKAVEGADRSGVLLGTSTSRADAALLFHGGTPGGVRTRTHMYEFWTDKDGKETGRLFDLVKDPYELDDVAAKNRKLARSLRERVRELAARIGT